MQIMATKRLRQQAEQLLDEAQEAVTRLDWAVVRDRARAVLSLDQGNADGLALLAIAERELGESSTAQTAPPSLAPPSEQPTSFANRRYEVKRFLGEGGKKRVYLAQDTLLDREVAFALIKTEGLDEVSRTRITREAQAMGRLAPQCRKPRPDWHRGRGNRSRSQLRAPGSGRWLMLSFDLDNRKKNGLRHHFLRETFNYCLVVRPM